MKLGVITVMIKGNTATSRGRRIVLVTICLAAFAMGGAAYWYWGQGSAGAHAARVLARAGVPVSVAIVQRQDVPIYLTGLGTVQASYTVGIHTQVDGKLVEVRFTEGQHVKAGEVLAKIDPRLYQAALDQAKAKRAQDAAALVAAEKDLARNRGKSRGVGMIIRFSRRRESDSLGACRCPRILMVCRLPS